MKLLLHICCAPCSIYPIRCLREGGHDLIGFFHNNNIHPYTEYRKREETLIRYAQQIELQLIAARNYDMERFIRAVAFRETERCRHCYYDRLKATALLAKQSKFEAFSSTLLYSKFQKHEMIQSIGQALSTEIGIPFLYVDFRAGWKEGVEASKQIGMYRQPYCGCIYSEKERYWRPGNPKK